MRTWQGMKEKRKKQRPVGSSASKKVSIPRLQKKKKRLKGYGRNDLNVITSALYRNCGNIYLSARSVVIIIVLVARNIMSCCLMTKNSLNFLIISAAKITLSLLI